MNNLQKEELEKCKNDIVYFIETYLYPTVKLNDFQKQLLRAYQEGKQIRIITGRGGKQMLLTSMEKYEDLKNQKT